MTPSWESLALTYLAAVVWVGLKSAQQLHVVNDRWRSVPMVSLGMACTEFWVVGAIARGHWLVIIPIWLGGVTGCWFSMWRERRRGGRGRVGGRPRPAPQAPRRVSAQGARLRVLPPTPRQPL